MAMLRSAQLSIGADTLVARPGLKPGQRSRDLQLFTCPPNHRAIVRDISCYIGESNISSVIFFWVTTPELQQAWFATRSVEIGDSDYHWQGQVVLDPGDTLGVDVSTTIITWIVSGAILPIQ